MVNVYDHELTQLPLGDRAGLAIGRILPMSLPATVAAAAARGDDPLRVRGRGTLTVSGRWSRDETGPIGRPDLATTRARGELRAARGRAFPVDIELAPWSDTTTELVLRPAARAPHRWGDRRLRRWFGAAHATADALRSELLVTEGADARRRHTPATAQDEPAATDQRRAG